MLPPSSSAVLAGVVVAGLVYVLWPEKKEEYAVIGDAFVDVVAPGVKRLPDWNKDSLADEIALHAGGSAMNTALHLQELGRSTVLHTSVGQDDFGRFLLTAARRRGLHVRNHRQGKGSTGACVVLSGPKDRAFVTSRGVINTFRASSSKVFRHPLRHVHIAGYYNCPVMQAEVPSILRTARRRGVTSSVGVQSDATGTWHGIARAPLLANDAAPDFLILSEDEARSVVVMNCGRPTNGDGAADDARTLLAHGAAVVAVVVTVGAKGALAAAFSSDGITVLRQKAAQPRSFVDATGAGDAFAAGFIAGLASKSLRTALASGCSAGAACVSNLGASASLHIIHPPSPVLNDDDDDDVPLHPNPPRGGIP